MQAETQSGLDAAINAYRLALTPLDELAILDLIAVMAALQAHRSENETEGEFKIEQYAKRLAGFPADCVSFACKKSRQWFPTWFELEQDIIEKLGNRKSTYEHLLGGTVLTDEQKAATKRGQERDQCTYQIKKNVYERIEMQKELDGFNASIERDPESPFNTNRKNKADILTGHMELNAEELKYIRNDKPEHITDEEFDELVASFQPLTQVPREREKPKPKIKMTRTKDEQLKELLK